MEREETIYNEMLQIQTRVEAQFRSSQIKYIKEQRKQALPPNVSPWFFQNLQNKPTESAQSEGDNQ